MLCNEVIVRICWMHADHGSRSQSSSDVDSDDDDRMGQPPEGTKETRPLDTSSVTVTKLHQQPSCAHPSGYDPNRYDMPHYQSECKCYH